MGQKTKRFLTLPNVLHPRDDKDRLNVLRKEVEKEPDSIEESVDVSIQGLEGHIKKIIEGPIPVVSNSIGKTRTERQQNLGNKNGNKNKRLDISSNKLTRLLTRRHEYGKKDMNMAKKDMKMAKKDVNMVKKDMNMTKKEKLQERNWIFLVTAKKNAEKKNYFKAKMNYTRIRIAIVG